MTAVVAPSGELFVDVIRGARHLSLAPPVQGPSGDVLRFGDVVRHGCPHIGLGREVNGWRARNLPNLWRGYWRTTIARRLGLPTMYGALWLTIVRGDGQLVNLGLASMRVVTTAGVNKIVAVLNTTDASTATTFKYHGFGTGSTAEASGDTALVTELTTEYVVNSTRPTGTQTVGASNNIYRSVATLAPDSGTPVLREHGVFSASSAGTLLDRTVFAAVTLDSSVGDSLATTYELTFAAGS